MEIEYSRHLIERLKIRNIEESLPKYVFENSIEHFHDEETGHLIALMNVSLYGRMRDVMVAYLLSEGRVKLLTIHPLKDGQKEQRISSGRWRRL